MRVWQASGREGAAPRPNNGWAAGHGGSASGRTGSGLLAAVLNALPLAVRLIEAGGATVHENTALRRLIETSTGDCLDVALDHVRQNALQEIAAPLLVCEGRYEITAVPVAASPDRNIHELIALIVRAVIHPPFDTTIIAERFGLTLRQAQVALLLGRGLRNDAIAKSLGVTAHTARRHTEAVLARLGVRARAEVAAALANVTATEGRHRSLVK